MGDTFDASVSPFNHYYYEHRCLEGWSARVKKIDAQLGY